MTRVLVVDDEIDTLNLLRTILEISGFQPVVTLNSVDAITLAEVEHPDVILLDIMMPQLDGFTLCKMMRVNPATMNLPIVFVTAYSSLDLEDRRKEAGADMVLPKPIGMDTLVDAVEKATTLRPAKPAAPPVPAPITPSTPAPISEIKTSPLTPPPPQIVTTPVVTTQATDGKPVSTGTLDLKPADGAASTAPKAEPPLDAKPATAVVPASSPTEKKD